MDCGNFGGQGESGVVLTDRADQPSPFARADEVIGARVENE